MDELERLRRLPLPFAALLGIRFTAASRDRVVAEMSVREELCTRPAVLHGGAIMAFADTLGAAATVLNLPEGAWTTTIESKTNFLAAAPVGTTVIGESLPVHRGRRTMVWQTRVTNEADGRLIAVIAQTQMVLEPKPAPLPLPEQLVAALKGRPAEEQAALLTEIERECAAAYRRLADEEAADPTRRRALLEAAARHESAATKGG